MFQLIYLLPLSGQLFVFYKLLRQKRCAPPPVKCYSLVGVQHHFQQYVSCIGRGIFLWTVIIFYLNDKEAKGQTTIYETLHRKLKIEHREPH